MRPMLRIRPAGWSAMLALLALLASVASAVARPRIREGFFAAYPSAVGTRLDNLPTHSGHCGVCHYDFNGGGTRNLYGQRVEQVINQAPACSGNDQACFTARILSITTEDSDADGFTQNTEITAGAPYTNTPTFPGLTSGNVGSVSNVNVAEILAYLTPTLGSDTQAPVVTVTAPNGGESWTGGQQRTITWTATDNIGVTAVDVFYRDSESAPWTPLGLNLGNSGSLTWFVHNTPTTAARARVVARDAAGNSGSDQSNGLFTLLTQAGGIVPTTLRDFTMPGTQPFGAGSFSTSTACLTCHGGYDSAVEPGHNAKGMMMMQAARDPLFYACLAIAEQDAPSSGDLCIRCHSPFGWLQGRSQPTSGTQLTLADRDGVACDFCHRAVDPIYKPGVSPAEDQAVLGLLLPAHVPTTYANGQYVIDPDSRKRGPFDTPVAGHAWLNSAFHRSSEFCGTCHDVSNPVFNRVGATADYVAGPLDQAATAIQSAALMPLERTYSEWKNSLFPTTGVFAPDFAGNKPDGMVSSCQDCHLRDVNGKGCNDVAAPQRTNLPLHDMMGGNSWLGPVIAGLYPAETDPAALTAGASRSVSMLRKAALVDVAVARVSTAWQATVTVTNRAGHKLPTGYPEGRRMWLNVRGYDLQGQKIYESGAYDAATGVLSTGGDAVVYEAHLGISPALATALGLTLGPSFHFALNDTLYKDNRIPPQGFTNAAFDAFGGKPVDESRPAPRYADGQNWDVSTFAIPAQLSKVVATLYYQTTSKEYVEFLRDRNSTNTAGQTMFNAWANNGRSPPVWMAADSTLTTVSVSDEPSAVRTSLSPRGNPSVGPAEFVLTLRGPAPVNFAIYDARGRQISARELGTLGPGAQRLVWNGLDSRGRDVGSGVFWARVQAGAEVIHCKFARRR